jgi:hypothetical protein
VTGLRPWTTGVASGIYRRLPHSARARTDYTDGSTGKPGPEPDGAHTVSLADGGSALLRRVFRSRLVPYRDGTDGTVYSYYITSAYIACNTRASEVRTVTLTVFDSVLGPTLLPYRRGPSARGEAEPGGRPLEPVLGYLYIASYQ